MNTIVVGTDFSPASDAACAQALEIAARFGARVVFVHASPRLHTTPETPAVLVRYGEEAARAHRENADAMLRSLCLECDGRGVPVSYRILDDHPDVALPRLAADLRADLIALGPLGRARSARFLLGTVAERTIRMTDRNVLIARPLPADARGYRRVLVPTDFSHAAEEALRLALQLVAEGGSIELFHCWYPPVIAADYMGPATLPNLIEDVREDAIARATLLLERFRTEHTSVEFNCIQAPPAAGILERLAQSGWDLVVMGSHGRRGARRFLLGSVAERTARHAPCSVLVTHGAS